MTDLDDFERWMRRKSLSPNTIKQRRKFAARRYAAWNGWSPDRDDLAEWLSQYQGWSRRTYHSHLECLFEWLTASGRVDASPVEGLRRPPAPRPRPNPLHPAQVELVLSAAAPRPRAWILLGLYAGLRAHEIAKMHGRDITEASLFVLGKGGQGATVPTHPVLWELAQQFPRDGYWFPSTAAGHDHVSAGRVSAVVTQVFRSVGIDDGSVHRARATYGTDLLRAGVNLRVIQDLMRHESLTSTEHYLRVEDAERRSAILALGRTAA